METSLDTKVFAPPTFETPLPTEFEVIAGQNLYYEYPLIVEGDNPGWTALGTVSDALDEMLVFIHERRDPNTDELISFDLEVISECTLH